MKIPRNPSGRFLVQVLVRELGYRLVHERGSHLALQTDLPTSHRIAIPDNENLRIGTLNNIITAVARHKHMTKDDILLVVLQRHDPRVQGDGYPHVLQGSTPPWRRAEVVCPFSADPSGS
jgi:predicted RNA binding protein YcfA (HicA-like mRNA interferase family)